MVNIVHSTERGSERSLDKSKFKLRWHRASDHRAFNNTENGWANSCHGLPQQSNRKGTISGEKYFFFVLETDANENRMAFNKQQSWTPLLNLTTNV